MGIFDKSNYIINTSIIEQVFQCTAEVMLLAEMIKLWKFVVGSYDLMALYKYVYYYYYYYYYYFTVSMAIYTYRTRKDNYVTH